MRHGELFENGNELSMVSSGEFRLDSQLGRFEEELVGSQFCSSEHPVARNVGERRTPPQRERVGQQSAGVGDIVAEKGPSMVDEPLEPNEIDLEGGKFESVPVARSHHLLGSDDSSKVGYVALHQVDRRCWRIVGPQRVDDHLDGVRTARVVGEKRQQLANFRCAQFCQRAVIALQLGRAEEADIHRSSVTPALLQQRSA